MKKSLKHNQFETFQTLSVWNVSITLYPNTYIFIIILKFLSFQNASNRWKNNTFSYLRMSSKQLAKRYNKVIHLEIFLFYIIIMSSKIKGRLFIRENYNHTNKLLFSFVHKPRSNKLKCISDIFSVKVKTLEDKTIFSYFHG